MIHLKLTGTATISDLEITQAFVNSNWPCFQIPRLKPSAESEECQQWGHQEQKGDSGQEWAGGEKMEKQIQEVGMETNKGGEKEKGVKTTGGRRDKRNIDA